MNQLPELANYLLQDGIIDMNQMMHAYAQSQKQNNSLFYYLLKEKIILKHILLDYLSKKFSIAIFDITQYDFAWFNNTNIKFELIYRYRFLPLYHQHNIQYIAISDPTDHSSIHAINFQLNTLVKPMLVAENDIIDILNSYQQKNALHVSAEHILTKILPEEQTENIQSDPNHQQDEPIIQFTNELIIDAINKSISDIHIEFFKEYCRIRYRCDGLLYEKIKLPIHLAMRLTTRLKIMAQLNIAEKRLPQDGRIMLHEQKQIDIRINTCPTLFGEKIVLRLLNITKNFLNLSSLGLNDTQQNIFYNYLHYPQGLILVTGPTGSGKTLTLYSALHHLNNLEKNIITIEDPIEIELPGINQVNINHKIGFDFAQALRAFLRQDPDIIMIGEIRDKETAQMALQAAQTGHLVLSTLHTNSAIEAVFRLLSMGIPIYQMINALSLVIAQRLIRILCIHCKQQETSSAHNRNYFSSFINDETIFKEVGCEQCHKGFSERIGIFECIPITQQISELLLSQKTMNDLLAEAKRQKNIFLWDAALEKVQQGITSIAEVVRVLGALS